MIATDDIKFNRWQVAIPTILFVSGIIGLRYCVSAIVTERRMVDLQHRTQASKDIERAISEFQARLQSDNPARAWELLSAKCKSEISLEQFSKLDWLKEDAARAYIANLKIKTVEPMDARTTCVRFRRTDFVMRITVDGEGNYRIDDRVMKFKIEDTLEEI